MSATVAEINAVIEQLWPSAGAQSWDASGFLVGDPVASVERLHLAVDAVAETVDEAISIGAQALLVHHPLLLRGVTAVAEDHYKGAMIARLIRAGCALMAAHTNADIVQTGTSAVMAAHLGLLDTKPIVDGADAAVGLGRVGTLPEPMALGRLARMLGEILPATASGIRVAGDYEREVSTVAVCAGAGDSLLSNPVVLAADVYITSDLRHHPASEARENASLTAGPSLIDVSHWASEWLWLETAAAELQAALPAVAISVSEIRTDPWDFVVMQ